MADLPSSEDLRKLLDEATPGPWKAEHTDKRGAWIAGATYEWTALSCGETDSRACRNAALIALAPSLAAEVLTLRTRISTLERERDEGRKALNRYRYALAWCGADAWDMCGDCRARIDWARALDDGSELTNDQIAAVGAIYTGLAHPTSAEER